MTTRTILYYDARFDPKTILINMLWIRRMGPPVIFDTTIPRDRVINFQFSMGIAMLTGLKLNLYVYMDFF